MSITKQQEYLDGQGNLLPLFANGACNKGKLDFIKSPLNYIGGKGKLLPQLIPLFPKEVNTFVDLLCGGCSVGINSQCQRVVFNDNLVYLMDLYEVLAATSIDDTLSYIDERIKHFDLSLTNGEGYNALRNEYNTNRKALDLFVLIAYSFNHQIRFNNSHKFNNPFGKERSHFNDRMKSNLIAFIEAFQSKEVSFTHQNFDELDLSFLGKNDFVYADPPYLISTGTYNDGKRGFTGWTIKEETALLALLDSLNERNIRFALSNVMHHKGLSNYLLIKWCKEKKYNVHYLDKRYDNSNYQCDRSKDTKTLEVLVTNY